MKITSLRTIWISTSVLLCNKSLIVCISVYLYAKCLLGVFHGGSGGKETACNARDPDLIPGSGRSPGEGNGYLLQYSCLENSMDREAWQEWVAKSWTRLKQLTLSLFNHSSLYFPNNSRDMHYFIRWYQKFKMLPYCYFCL